MFVSGRAQIASTIIAVVSWTGLVFLLADQTRRMNGDVLAAFCANCRFLTDLSNLLIALGFTTLAIAPWRVSALLFGMPLVSTLTATLVYYGLLGVATAWGRSGAGDVIADAVSPALFTMFWLLIRRSERLAWRDIPIWASFPIGYCAYAITGGRIDGRYPYVFLNVPQLGPAVAIYIFGILSLFCGIVALVVAVDRRIER